jgi:hypothetical protein
VRSIVPCASTALGTLPCETDRAKPDRISRLARSTNLSKILEGDPPERYPLDRGLNSRSGCPRTWCATLIFRACTTGFGVLARTFQRYQNVNGGSRKESIRTAVDNRVRAAQRSKSGQQKLPEPIGLAGDKLPGHAMACSLRGSLQGFNGAQRAQFVRPYEPASHFPQMGQAHSHREAPLLSTTILEYHRLHGDANAFP